MKKSFSYITFYSHQVTTESFPHFEKPVPVQYVVEVLDIMWELGYDGHNLQEIAR